MKLHTLMAVLFCAVLVLPVSAVSPSLTSETAEDYSLQDYDFPGLEESTEYYTYETMTEYMFSVKETRQDIVQMESIGVTYEGRDIWALRVTGPGNPDDKPGVLLLGAHHAREWISFEVPIAIIKTLLAGYGTDTRITWLVDNRDIWIVPMVNPDGVAYMQETGNNWRKNRQPWRGDHIVGSAIQPIGVDLNRNYGYKWGYPNVATTQNPYSDTYRGPEPFSERETRAVRDLAQRRQFSTCISYHSYSELILYPWGYTPDVGAMPVPPPDEDIYQLVGGRMAEMTGYTLSQANELYPASGDTTDYLYATHGTISFTFELATQFIPPPEEILGVSLPNVEAALFLVEVSDNPRMDGPVVSHQQTQTTISAGKDYTVSAAIESSRGVREARIYYSIDGGRYHYVSMQPSANGIYIGAIPGHNGGEVNYYVWAQDVMGHHSTNMTYAPIQAYSYTIHGGQAGSLTFVFMALASAIVCMGYITIRKRGLNGGNNKNKQLEDGVGGTAGAKKFIPPAFKKKESE